MRERHYPPPRAVPPKREYLDGGCRKGGLGGRAAGVDQGPLVFIKEKSQVANILSLARNICLSTWLVPLVYWPYKRGDFFYKKLQ